MACNTFNKSLHVARDYHLSHFHVKYCVRMCTYAFISVCVRALKISHSFFFPGGVTLMACSKCVYIAGEHPLSRFQFESIVYLHVNFQICTYVCT